MDRKRAIFWPAWEFKIDMSHRICNCLLIIALVSGCSSGEKAKFTRNPLAGTVTLDGQPLPKGTITFEPAPGETMATAGGAAIADGKFELSQESGLVAGTYRVFISSAEATESGGKSADDLMNNPPAPAKERIPDKYNTQSMLTAEITKDKKTTLKFELKSSE